jgi:hypothetical protein
MSSKYQKNSRLLKTSLLLLVFSIAVMMFTSCKSREKCAAYGEYRKFQQEQGY